MIREDLLLRPIQQLVDDLAVLARSASVGTGQTDVDGGDSGCVDVMAGAARPDGGLWHDVCDACGDACRCARPNAGDAESRWAYTGIACACVRHDGLSLDTEARAPGL